MADDAEAQAGGDGDYRSYVKGKDKSKRRKEQLVEGQDVYMEQSDGSKVKMVIIAASKNPGTNKMEYKLKDEDNKEYGHWVVEDKVYKR